VLKGFKKAYFNPEYESLYTPLAFCALFVHSNCVSNIILKVDQSQEIFHKPFHLHVNPIKNGLTASQVTHRRALGYLRISGREVFHDGRRMSGPVT
jgi:hypothetical protein